MNALSRRRFLPLVTLGTLSAGLVSCRSAGIKDVYTCRDSAGRLKTKTFQNDDTEIHIIIEMVSGRDDVVLIVNLRVPEGAPAQTDVSEFAPGKGDHKIDLKLFIEDGTGQRDEDGPWASGLYGVDILLDGELEESLEFTVL